MKVTVNDRPVAADPAGQTTLRELLDELRQRGEIPPDHVVVGLTAAGHPCGNEDFQARLHQPLDGLADLAIDTTDLSGYGRRILADADSALNVLCEAAGKIAEQFRQGLPKEASGNLYNLLDSTQGLLICLSQVKATCLPDAPDSLLSAPAVEQFDAALDAVQACQEAEDWPALADRIDESLLPALRAFHDVVEALGSAI